MNTIRLAEIKENDVVDGDGITVSVWLQGCPHHCPGCHNPDTWDFKGSNAYIAQEKIREILQLLNKNNIKRDLSLLGGEPLCEQNIEFSLALAAAAHKQYPNIKVYCWTGYTLEELKEKYSNPYLLNDIDILIDGKFILSQRDITLKFRGSPNQRILYKGVDY